MYTIKDFIKGDLAYHLSKPDFIMVVIEVNIELNEVLCTWTDNKNQSKSNVFQPEELGKKRKMPPKITIIGN
jgi:hypothetical protein